MDEQRAARIPLRIVVGVTGHREFADRDDLGARVGRALERIREALPAADETPVVFTVLSPLAEGADRLVAERVLATAGAVLDVVLPCAREKYLDDFRTPDSRRDFEALLERARKVTVLAHPGTGGDAYEDAGRYVVDHCDVLIAIWDGQAATGRGGTGEIVSYAKARKRPVLVIDPATPGGAAQAAGAPIRPVDLAGLHACNREPPVQGSGGGDPVAALVESAGSAGIDREEIRAVAAGLAPYHERVDALAMRHQKRHLRAVTWIPLLAAAAVVVVVFQALYLPALPELVFFEVAFMVVILATLWFGKRRGWHRRWIDYRFLAERFRSAVFLSACGVEQPPMRPPRVLEGAAADADWVAAAVCSVWNGLPVIHRPAPLEALKKFVGSDWLQDQVRYHRRTAHRHHRRHLIFSLAGEVLFGLTLLAAVLHALEIGPHAMHNLLSLLGVSFPALGGAFAGMREAREHHRLAARAAEIAARLEELETRLQRAADHDALARLVTEAEELMQQENADWRVLLRFRPPELPA